MNSARTGATTLVVIPTYNEIINLPLIIDRVRAARPDVDILVVDDASPDGTGELADQLSNSLASVNVLHRSEKNGLGGAYLAGFAWGMGHGYDILVEMDADGSHQPEQLGSLLDAVDHGADFVIGSRWVPGGEVVNWPRRRKLLSIGGNTYTRLLLGSELRDITGGYRAIRRSTLEAIGIDQIDSAGYCFQVDLAWRALLAGADVREVPITFVERVHGTSKMSTGIVIEALARVTSWALAHHARTTLGFFRRTAVTA